MIKNDKSTFNAKINVVGVSFYQKELERICANKHKEEIELYPLCQDSCHPESNSELVPPGLR